MKTLRRMDTPPCVFLETTRPNCNANHHFGTVTMCLQKISKSEQKQNSKSLYHIKVCGSGNGSGPTVLLFVLPWTSRGKTKVPYFPGDGSVNFALSFQIALFCDHALTARYSILPTSCYKGNNFYDFKFASLSPRLQDSIRF